MYKRLALSIHNNCKALQTSAISTSSTITKFNQRSKNNEHRNNFVPKVILGVGFASWIAYKLYDKREYAYLKDSNDDLFDKCSAGVYNPSLPSYSLDEVYKHTTKENRIWVTFRQGVYDITDFVSEHPGGDQILLAAGSAVEPFWLLYAVHSNAHVLNILETLRIGNLSAEDAKQALQGMTDPYSNDPKRHAALKPTSLKPFNAEVPPSLLVQNFLTPNELFYVRNHLPVPDVDLETYELEIEVEGTDKSITLTYDDIKKFPKHTVTATVMCAGNRRSEMTKIKAVKGLDWGTAVIGNATWSGARLRDVLKIVGIDEDTTGLNHVQFEGLDVDPTGKSYGASIPFWKAIDKRGDVILAYEMNGQPIPRDHGFPIRAIVPGVVGARNVKWLGRINVSQIESDSHWQQFDYKGFSPSTDWDTVDFTKAPAIQELPVTSAICSPCPGESVAVKDGFITIQGYAWSGGGQKIVRVDTTIDQGNTWHVADLVHQHSSSPPQHWAWTLWTSRIPVPDGQNTVEIWAKAVDSCYNTQPEDVKHIWNLRGVLSNAYHRVSINLVWSKN